MTSFALEIWSQCLQELGYNEYQAERAALWILALCYLTAIYIVIEALCR